jgi:hypothetical protein
MKPQEFTRILATICDAQTSQDPSGWSTSNHLWGHCAVVSLLAQDLFGGTLQRVSLEDTPFAASRSHYYNQLPTGLADFTAEQFGTWSPTNLPAESRTREYVLSHEPTRVRYELLKARFARYAPRPTR